MSLHGLSRAFRRCVGELGMWSASRLFVETAERAEGAAGLQALADALGAEFPVLGTLASRGPLAPPPISPLVELCRGLRRLVALGLETDVLGPLLEALPAEVEVAIVPDPTFPFDAERLCASWEPRATLTDLASFQRWAGTRSALYTTVYGSNGFRAAVSSVWMRGHGADIRTQFRHLIGFDVLPGALDQYPRWLIETEVSDFTELVGGP